MLRISNINSLREKVRLSATYVAVAVMAVAGLAPVFLQGTANAGTLSSRSVTISTSQPDATGVSYSFAFTTTQSAAIQSMIFQFCSTPLGTCTLPGGAGAANKIDVDAGTAAPGSFTGTNATAFAEVSTDSGACSDADGGGVGLSTMYCVNRTQAAAEAVGAKTFQITGISNPTIASGNNEPVYVRVSTYSDTAFATPVDSGTVAAAIVNQLTVTGRVQERLVFCVFALDDSAASSGTVGAAATNFPTNCSASEATASSNVDIGVVDNLSIAQSPVDNSPPTALGNDRVGAAMVNTNASNGISITYYATPATSGTNQLTAFRVAGATCNASSSFIGDQCFTSASDSSATTFAAGTEDFGMNIACVTNTNTTTAGTTANLGSGGNGSGTGGTFNTVYADGKTTLTGGTGIQDNGTDNCENSAGTAFGWRTTGVAQALISSTTVVDDELVKLRFAATADPTTPTGTYTVASTFIATPTF